MKNEGEELIEIKEDNFITKIKKFFKNMFKKQNAKKEKIAKLEEIQNNKKENFKEKIKVNENREKNEILELQKKYQNGEIKEEDFSEKQIDLLLELYEKQISEITSRIEYKKQKLLKYYSSK